MKVRTRFAPSPTGYLHIGSLRTCLYNYLFARHHEGTFILRVEDTDQTRFVEGAVENLLKVLAVFDMLPDEGPVLPANLQKPLDRDLTDLTDKGDKGPYVQSKRTELYQEYAKKLIDTGHAYYCFCSPEDLDKMRTEQESAKLAPMYDRRCLKLSPEESQAKLAAGGSYVIRLKMPRDRKIEFVDAVRGKVSFMGNQIDDQVLIKSDGLPTYHLANVVDDHFMDITHVLRAEEWLASTPKHLVMFEAFGWTAPEYAHLPLILNADKSKLSKRQNDVSVESYLDKGYSKEALINFVVMMGWHPGKGSEQEVFNMENLIAQFSLEGVHKAGAVFNPEKLDWLNHTWQKIKYFQKLDHEALKLNSSVKIDVSKNFDHAYQFENNDTTNKFQKIRAEILAELSGLNNHPQMQTDSEKLFRALLVNEEKILQNPAQTWELIAYLFEDSKLNPALLQNPKMGVDSHEKALESLKFANEIVNELTENSDLNEIKEAFMAKIKAAGRKNGEILWPLRAALTRQEFSIGAFESLWVLGKAESAKRLAEIIK